MRQPLNPGLLWSNKAYVLFICPLLQPSCGHLFLYHLVPFPGCAFVEATAAPSKRLFELNAWMPMLVKGEEVIWIWETEEALISEANRWIHLDSQLVNIYWVFIRCLALFIYMVSFGMPGGSGEGKVEWGGWTKKYKVWIIIFNITLLFSDQSNPQTRLRKVLLEKIKTDDMMYSSHI